MIGTAIGAAAGLLGGAINWFSQKNENKKNREWSEKMYEKQHADQVADWNMMNEYNSPSAQAERLASAGLNRNLLYGSGTPVTPAGQVPSGSFPNSSQRAPQVDLSQFDMLGRYLQLRSLEQDVRGKELENDEKEAGRPYWSDNAYLNSEQLVERLHEIQSINDLRDYRVEVTRQSRLVRNYLLYCLDEDGEDLPYSEKPNWISWEDWSESRHLSNGPLGNQIKAELIEKHSSVSKLLADLAMVEEQLKLMPAKLRSQEARAVVDEFEADLARAGLNPRDSVIARVLLQLFGGGDSVAKKGRSVVSKVIDFISDPWPD